MQVTIPNNISTWLRAPEEPDAPERTRELRIQLSSDGSEHRPARITAIASLWREVPDVTGRVRSVCLCDAEARDLERALVQLDHVLMEGP